MLDLVFLLVVLYGVYLIVCLYDTLLFLLKIYIFHIRGYYHVSLLLVYSSTLLSYKVSFCLYMFGIYSSYPIKKNIRYYLTSRVLKRFNLLILNFLNTHITIFIFLFLLMYII